MVISGREIKLQIRLHAAGRACWGSSLSPSAPPLHPLSFSKRKEKKRIMASVFEKLTARPKYKIKIENKLKFKLNFKIYIVEEI